MMTTEVQLDDRQLSTLTNQINELREETSRLIALYSGLKAEVSELREIAEEHLPRQMVDDRKRINAIEDLFSLQEQPRPKQKDQGDMLRAMLLAANSWVPAKQIRQKMDLNKVQFSQLLKVSKAFVEVKVNPLDKREKMVKINY